jgi:hypothetical protein
MFFPKDGWNTKELRVRLRILILFLATLCPFLPAQRVDPTNTHFRMWVVDTVVVDPQTKARKPAHAGLTGMLGYTVLYHPKDPTICLVEYVHRQYHGFDTLKQDIVAGVALDTRLQTWNKNSTKPQDVAAAALALGFGNIDFHKFSVRVP